jgi:hypothetical protein
MTKTDIAKRVVGFVVGAGTTKIVGSIIQKNTEFEKKTDRIAVASASLVIGTMAADTTKKYTDAKIDEIVNWWEKNVKPKI